MLHANLHRPLLDGTCCAQLDKNLGALWCLAYAARRQESTVEDVIKRNDRAVAIQATPYDLHVTRWGGAMMQIEKDATREKKSNLFGERTGSINATDVLRAQF